MGARTQYNRVRSHALLALFRIVHRLTPGPRLTRLGSDYGGYLVPLDLLDGGSVCYSGGVGEDTTFDEALIERVGCSVHAFDPTPRAIAHAEKVSARESRFHFTPVGMWSSDTVVEFFAPADPAHVSHSIGNLQRTDRSITVEVRRLSTLMKSLGHDQITLLKLDIEGAEHEVLQGAFADGIHPKVICVEFDQPARISAVQRSVRRLRHEDYVLVGAEHWNLTFVRT